MAGRLVFIILMTVLLAAKGKDLGPPTLSVHPSVITEFSAVSLYCQPPSYVSVSSCSFYSLSGLQWVHSSCVRTLKGSDLLKKFQAAPAEVQLRCYYTEQNEEMSPSSLSNETVVTVKALARPTLTLEPSVITEMDRVNLHCQPPSYVSASSCYFYIMSASSRKPLDTTDCVQSVRGSDLLLVNESLPVELQIQCYYIVKDESNVVPSPHSEKRSIIVQDNSTATKHLVTQLIVPLIACGVAVGCVMMVINFCRIKQRNDSQAPNDSGQPLTDENRLGQPEPAADSQAWTGTENRADFQQEEIEMNLYHEYASIPGPASVSAKTSCKALCR